MLQILCQVKGAEEVSNLDVNEKAKAVADQQRIQS